MTIAKILHSMKQNLFKCFLLCSPLLLTFQFLPLSDIFLMVVMRLLFIISRSGDVRKIGDFLSLKGLLALLLVSAVPDLNGLISGCFEIMSVVVFLLCNLQCVQYTKIKPNKVQNTWSILYL